MKLMQYEIRNILLIFIQVITHFDKNEIIYNTAVLNQPLVR